MIGTQTENSTLSLAPVRCPLAERLAFGFARLKISYQPREPGVALANADGTHSEWIVHYDSDVEALPAPILLAINAAGIETKPTLRELVQEKIVLDGNCLRTPEENDPLSTCIASVLSAHMNLIRAEGSYRDSFNAHADFYQTCGAAYGMTYNTANGTQLFDNAPFENLETRFSKFKQDIAVACETFAAYAESRTKQSQSSISPTKQHPSS